MSTFTHNDMAKLLDLQSLIIYSITEGKNHYDVKCGRLEKPRCCPTCKSKIFGKHGKGKLRKMRHGITVAGKGLFVLWQGHRFKCKDCKRTWTKAPPVWLVDGRQRCTIACKKQALRTLKGTSFKETERQTGLGYGTLRKSLEENITDTTLLDIPNSGKLTLGIDEHSRAKRSFATTITLIKPERRLLAILPVKSNKTLEEWVLREWTATQRYRVKEVCVDMAKCWYYIVPKLFPRANVVIDHFNVISYLNQIIQDEYRVAKNMASAQTKKNLPYKTKGVGVTRKLFQGGIHWNDRDKENIKTIFIAFPRVAELWYWKEEVRRIYLECADKLEARMRWKIVLEHLDELPKKTLELHLENILNYFDNRSTNAFTEGVHTKFKLIKRCSYGIKNKEIYVKKLILGFLQQKTLIHNHTY